MKNSIRLIFLGVFAASIAIHALSSDVFAGKKKRSSRNRYFVGPDNKAEFNQVIRAVVNEHFNNNGYYPLDTNGKPMVDPATGKISADYQRYLRRVQYMEEMASHESTEFKPLVHNEKVRRTGKWQTVIGWFQMRQDTFESLLSNWVAWSARKNINLPSFFKEKCGASNEKKGTGVYSLHCQAWIVNWEMAASDPYRDTRGKKSELHQWGPVSRAEVDWKKAHGEANYEFKVALASLGSTPQLGQVVNPLKGTSKISIDAQVTDSIGLKSLAQNTTISGVPAFMDTTVSPAD